MNIIESNYRFYDGYCNTYNDIFNFDNDLINNKFINKNTLINIIFIQIKFYNINISRFKLI